MDVADRPNHAGQPAYDSAVGWTALLNGSFEMNRGGGIGIIGVVIIVLVILWLVGVIKL